MKTTAILAMLGIVGCLVGCGDRPSDPAKLSEKEKEIIERAKRAVAQYEDWEDRAEYKIERRGSHWQVTAWRVERSQEKGNGRYVPWGNRRIILDDAGKVLEYGTRKQVTGDR
jgi:hypothetical protein